MIEGTQKSYFSWSSMRAALVRYFPDSVEEYDTALREGRERDAISLLQKKRIMDPDAWVIF